MIAWDWDFDGYRQDMPFPVSALPDNGGATLGGYPHPWRVPLSAVGGEPNLAGLLRVSSQNSPRF